MEARTLVSAGYMKYTVIQPTFEELLACVLLEERFVTHWTTQVVNHQFENRLDLFL